MPGSGQTAIKLHDCQALVSLGKGNYHIRVAGNIGDDNTDLFSQITRKPWSFEYHRSHIEIPMRNERLYLRTSRTSTPLNNQF